jgi:2-polyprenyl-6-methoxyphenol hydroxylase-like FAD-dependent oxidoreductase
MKHVDIIIIGSGMAGLYSGYKIKQFSPETSFLILEKYKKKWIGGRTSNDVFYGTEIVTGAGIGRKSKDKLLHKLLNDFHFETHEHIVNPQKSPYIEHLNVDILLVMNQLRKEYKNYKDQPITFKQFATKVLGEEKYMDFIETTGYTDYENDDVFEVLYYYGMEDNTCCWKSFSVPWKKLVMKLYEYIGEDNFQFSNKVTNITKINESPCKFVVTTEKGKQYLCNKVIVGTTIDGIRNLVPRDIYNDIEGQPFLRLYAKLDKTSSEILKEHVNGFTFLPSPLQRIIPMDPNKGVYMIAYNDNKNTLALKKKLENTKENREMYETLLEKSLGIPKNSLHIIALKDYYWPIGTHYYKPLNRAIYNSREEFIDKAQHPENGILVVGEVVSRNQGWTEGALESVKAVVTKKWVNGLC